MASNSTKRAVVVGGGIMGIGIAHAFLRVGWNVTLIDATAELSEKAAAKVAGVVNDGVKRGKVEQGAATEMLTRLEHRSEIAVPGESVDVAIEAVPENIALKHEILQKMELAEPRILASNTSALSIDDLASVLKRPESFLGMHFFNPVWVMQLLEIVIGEKTSDATKHAVVEIGKEIEKQTIVVRNAPGFATSRLGIALGLEAMRMLEEGVASAADIDTAMVLGYKHPVGPLRLTDMVGLDVRLPVSRNLAAVYGPRFDPPKILIDLVEAGHLGRKTGRGFYVWNEDGTTQSDS